MKAAKNLHQLFGDTSLFEGRWEEWLNLNVFLLASKMQLADVLYDDLFNNLPKERQSELIGRKADFAKQAGKNPLTGFCRKKMLYDVGNLYFAFPCPVNIVIHDGKLC